MDKCLFISKSLLKHNVKYYLYEGGNNYLVEGNKVYLASYVKDGDNYYTYDSEVSKRMQIDASANVFSSANSGGAIFVIATSLAFVNIPPVT